MASNYTVSVPGSCQPPEYDESGTAERRLRKHRGLRCCGGSSNESNSKVIRIHVETGDSFITLLLLPTMSVGMLKIKVAERVEEPNFMLFHHNTPLDTDAKTLSEAGIMDNSTIDVVVENVALEVLLYAAVGQIQGACTLGTFTDMDKNESEPYRVAFYKLLRASKSKMRPGEVIRLHLSPDSTSGFVARKDKQGERVFAVVTNNLELPDSPALRAIEEMERETMIFLNDVNKSVDVDQAILQPMAPKVRKFLQRQDAVYRSMGRP